MQIAEHLKPLTRPHFKQKRLFIVLEKKEYTQFWYSLQKLKEIAPSDSPNKRGSGYSVIAGQSCDLR